MATATGTDPRGFDRRAWIALGVLLVSTVASLAWLVHPWYEASDETNDAAIYIACAKSLASGRGYSYLDLPFSIRPPGMSLLIAPIVAFRGLDFHLINIWVSVFGIACVLLLFVHARPRLGTGLAFVVAAIVWLNDGFRELCNQAMSDVPGAALVVGCLALERWARRTPSWKRDVLLGIAIGLSAYMRSVAILLVPAIVLARLLDRDAERARSIRIRAARLVPLVASALFVVLPWEARNALVEHPNPPADQNFLYSYSTAMWHTDGGDPGSPLRSLREIAGRVPVRTEQVLATLGGRMRGGEGGLVLTIGALLFACALVIAWRRREPAELFVLAATGVVLVYFGFRARLVLPIWLLSLPAAAECALIALRRPLGPRGATISASMACVALACLDFHPRSSWDQIAKTDAAYREQAASIASRLPTDARVAAAIGWHYAVYLDRPVHSLFFAARRGGIEATRATLEKYRIDAVVLWPAVAADRGLLPWFQENYGPGEPAGAAFVFHVRAH